MATVDPYILYADTTSSITSNTITMQDWDNDTITIIGQDPPAKPKKKKAKPETALAWLDRRVDEMRLAL